MTNQEIFEQVIKIALENGLYINGRKTSKAELRLKNQVIVYFNDELASRYKVINFTEFITCKEFIEAITKYVYKDFEGNLDDAVRFTIDRVTTDQALAIRDNKLGEFYKRNILNIKD